MQHEILIDGGRFCDLEGFNEEFNRACVGVFGEPGPGRDLFDDFDEDLDATGDRLTLRWIHSQKSRSDLGHAGIQEMWTRSLAQCRIALPHAQFWHQHLQERIDQAAAGEGETLFDWLVFQLRSVEQVDLILE